MNLKSLITHKHTDTVGLLISLLITNALYPLGANLHSHSRLIAFPPYPSVLFYSPPLPLLLPTVPSPHPAPLPALRNVLLLCSHSLHCGIIINSHLGVLRFSHHRIQWRFMATILKGFGGMHRMCGRIVHIHRWLLCSYCLAFTSTEVDAESKNDECSEM